MIYYLTNPDIVSLVYTRKDWSPRNLLDMIACSEEYDALIDTGALITNMSNLEVAKYLLGKIDPSRKDGVVYIDEDGRKMIALRSGSKVVPLEQCGLAARRRFAFYDQVHTTGMDIKHAINANAVLTLDKSLTFRDFAQGAFRMRGIGKGQRVTLFVIPEVRRLIREHVTSGDPVFKNSVETFNKMRKSLSKERLNVAKLVDVSAWLHSNSMRMCWFSLPLSFFLSQTDR